MIIPGLKDVINHEIKEYVDLVAIHVSIAKKEQVFPSCGVKFTIIVYKKVKHLKWFERLTIFFYKRRRYVCV